MSPTELWVRPQRAEHLDRPCLHQADCRFVADQRRGVLARPATQDEIARGYQGACCDPWRSPNVRQRRAEHQPSGPHVENQAARDLRARWRMDERQRSVSVRAVPVPVEIDRRKH
jgi:hypothetical protein